MSQAATVNLPRINISKALTIGGWMSERELTWLAVAASTCKKIVEFGSYHGRSTRALADNSPEDAIIWAVDPWSGEPYVTDSGAYVVDIDTYCLPQFKDNLREYVDSGKVIPVRKKSKFFSLYEKVDMLFIDGDHRYESCYQDIVSGMSLVKPGGLLCGHDYGFELWPGVELAVKSLLNNFEVEETIWWTRNF